MTWEQPNSNGLLNAIKRVLANNRQMNALLADNSKAMGDYMKGVKGTDYGPVPAELEEVVKEDRERMKVVLEEGSECALGADSGCEEAVEALEKGVKRFFKR